MHESRIVNAGKISVANAVVRNLLKIALKSLNKY